MIKTISSYEIEKKIQTDRPYISIDHSTYVNTRIKCKFTDSEYGEWFALPSEVLRGTRHPNRAHKLTSYEVERRIKTDRPYISIDHSTYTNTTTKCKFIDSEYGEWIAAPSKILCGQNNPKRSRTFTSQEVEQHIQSDRPYISIDHSNYVNMTTKCRFVDSEYGEWIALPHNVFRSSNHPSRLSKVTSYEIEQRIQMEQPCVSIDHTTYIDTQTKCRFIDSEYGEWYAIPNNILNGQSNKLRSRQGFSKGEKELAEFIKQFINTEENITFKNCNKKFELDIFISSLNIGIEYCGLYWHSDKYKTNDYHFKKREFFDTRNIQLIQFYDSEWIDKQDIVKSIILAKIGKSTNKYQARKLELKQVDNKIAQQFLKQNHLMGSYKSAKYIGLYNKEELVSLLGYKRIKDGVDISRFCNTLNTSVAGGYSKLLKYIELIERPSFIQSYVDLRYGNGKALDKIGFELSSVTQGWNWTDFRSIYNRLQCTANMDGRKLTEKQHAEELGWYRIYDAGQAKYIKKVDNTKPS